MAYSKPQPEPEVFQPTAEIIQAVQDAQRLLAYIARDGESLLDETITQKLVDAKFLLANNQWNPMVEAEFLLQYDRLSAMIYPVTVQSINAIVPQSMNKKRERTKAERAVRGYRRTTMVSLVFLIMLQVYWLSGSDLLQNLKSLDTAYAQQVDAIAKADAAAPVPDLQPLKNRIQANYRLLVVWNSVWSFGSHLGTKQGQDNDVMFGVLFYEQMQAADFALNAFQGYLLPLLYGLLGALIFVLRTLLREIRALTYNFDSDIRYRLRMTLGALAGMIVGWFLKPDDAEALASLSPMALAFLMGYNVDVLFSIMDRAIDSIKSQIDKESPGPALTPKAPITPAAEEKKG